MAPCVRPIRKSWKNSPGALTRLNPSQTKTSATSASPTTVVTLTSAPFETVLCAPAWVATFLLEMRLGGGRPPPSRIAVRPRLRDLDEARGRGDGLERDRLAARAQLVLGDRVVVGVAVLVDREGAEDAARHARVQQLVRDVAAGAVG